MRLRPEEHVYVIGIVIPFFDGDVVIGSDTLEDLTQSFRYRVIDHPVAVFDAHDEMVMQDKH